MGLQQEGATETEVATELFNNNLPLIGFTLKRCSFSRILGPEESYSIASAAMWQAAQRYSPERGKFSTWATRHISWAISDRVKHDIRQRKNEPISITDEVEIHLGKCDETRPYETDEINDLHAALEILPFKDADILRRRHGIYPFPEPQTLAQVGTHYNIGKERVRQIEERALKTARNILERIAE